MMAYSQYNEEQTMLHVIRCCKEHKKDEFQGIIDELQPYDIAAIYRNLPEKHHPKFILMLEPKQIAVLIQELDIPLQVEMLQLLGVEKSSSIMNLMEKDDLADLLNGLSEERIAQFLSAMKKEESQYIQDLMSYPPDSAGGLMTNRFVSIYYSYTVREAVEKLKAYAEIAESINYLYVLNEAKQLVGVVSYRDLLLAEMNDLISAIMYERVISVPVDMDQEDVARTIQRYDFISVPVVDNQNHLLGIITVDDIIDVVIREANEDIEKLSASGKSIDFDTSAWTSSMRRLPWLILLLLIGLISGNIISMFDGTLEKVVALAFFMPMIAGMTGNTGTQSLAIVVRGLAHNDIDFRTILRLVFREFLVGLIIGITCGTLIAILGILWQNNAILGLVVGSSLFVTIIIGTLAGTMIPLLLYRLKIDPAVASGPLITTLNDIFSLTVYFTLATIFISHLL
ncbi:MAG TPA: magnesium transporter [Bacilli bacterium]